MTFCFVLFVFIMHIYLIMYIFINPIWFLMGVTTPSLGVGWAWSAQSLTFNPITCLRHRPTFHMNCNGTQTLSWHILLCLHLSPNAKKIKCFRGGGNQLSCQYVKSTSKPANKILLQTAVTNQKKMCHCPSREITLKTVSTCLSVVKCNTQFINFNYLKKGKEMKGGPQTCLIYKC